MFRHERVRRNPMKGRCRATFMNITLLALAVAASVAASGCTPVPAESRVAPQPSVDGAAIYARRCASCHDGGDARAPSRDTLRGLTAQRILRTLDFGSMMTIAYVLRRTEREAVANHLGRHEPEPGPRPEAFCADRTVTLASAPGTPAWNGWSPTSDNARHAAADVARLTAAQVPALRLLWAFGFEGDISAFGQPTVIGEQMFVGSAGGVVHALRAGTGCLQWTFQADGPIRSAIVATPFERGHLLLFGDLTGSFYALDAATGTLRWRKRPEAHEAVRLSAPPVVHDGLVLIPVASWEESRALNSDYGCCTFRGSLTALHLADGREAWKTYMVPTPPQRTGTTPTGAETLGPSGVGIWGSPTIDRKRGRIYVTTGNNYSMPATAMSDALVAMDLQGGAVLWSKQVLASDVYNSQCGSTPKGTNCPEGSGPDFDFGSPPILVDVGGGRALLLAGQKSGMVYAFDPDRRGEIVWQTRVGQGGINGGVQWGMSVDGRHVYAATSDVVTIRTATSRSLDPRSGGGLTALRVTDGSIVWRAEPVPCGDRSPCSPAQSAAVTSMPGVVFAGSLDGHLRAYDTSTGRVIWDVDTARPFTTVNGVKASGGAIDGPGVVVANGLVLVTSGYTRYGGMPGNVLLVFGAR